LKENAGALAAVGTSRLAVGADLVALRVLTAHLGRDRLGVGTDLVALAVLTTDDRGEDHRLGVGAHLVALGVLPANDRRLQIDISVVRRN
jgi:hypothetical protein